MRARTLILIIVSAVINLISGCNHNSPASIEGYWTFTSMQGISTWGSDTTIYTYSSNTLLLQKIDIDSSSRDTTAYTYALKLNIKNDGTYTDSESIAQNSVNLDVKTNTDTWTYSPNDPGGGTFTLNGLAQLTSGGIETYVFSLISTNPQCKVTYLDAHNLQLTDTWTYYRTSPVQSSEYVNYVMNFKR